MAPFKLKFRMGSSRSTSQETESDSTASSHHTTGGSSSIGRGTGAQQPLLHAHQQHHRSPSNSATGNSTTTLDSVEYTSLGSLNANEQRNLLPTSHSSSSDRTSYTNPTLVENHAEIIGGCVPQSPPPSYEYVLEENRLANLDKDNNPATVVRNNPIISISSNAINRASSPTGSNAASASVVDNHRYHSTNAGGLARSTSSLNETHQQRLVAGHSLLESPVFSYCTMTTPSQEDLLGNVDDGSSDPLFAAQSEENIERSSDDGPNDNVTTVTLVGDGSGSTLRRRKMPKHRLHANNNDGSFSDSDADNYSYSDNNDATNIEGASGQMSQCGANGDHQCDLGDDDDDDWVSHDGDNSYDRNQNVFQEDELSPDTIYNNKSTKEMYKAVAKKLGITCKMSSQCRCIDCQSNYFDCEYEENDHHKSDGGLGAGTPMFISDMMHGTTCTIL